MGTNFAILYSAMCVCVVVQAQDKQSSLFYNHNSIFFLDRNLHV